MLQNIILLVFFNHIKHRPTLSLQVTPSRVWPVAMVADPVLRGHHHARGAPWGAVSARGLPVCPDEPAQAAGGTLRARGCDCSASPATQGPCSFTPGPHPKPLPPPLPSLLSAPNILAAAEWNILEKTLRMVTSDVTLPGEALQVSQAGAHFLPAAQPVGRSGPTGSSVLGSALVF